MGRRANIGGAVFVKKRKKPAVEPAKDMRFPPADRLQMLVKIGAIRATNDDKFNVWAAEAFHRRNYVGIAFVDRQSSHRQHVTLACQAEFGPIPSRSISYFSVIHSIGNERDRLQSISHREIAAILPGDGYHMIRKNDLAFAQFEAYAADDSPLGILV